MRILHVVTLLSPDGAFGGPLRVALNQCAGLRERGHDVVLTAACRGYGTAPGEVSGVPTRLFPARTAVPGTGFAGLAAPGMLRWLRTELPTFDVAHIHLGRDLVTLPAARLAASRRVPFVAQTHGMVDPSGRRLAAPLDSALTVPLLRRAAAVFHLNTQEAADLRAVAGPALPLVALGNGVPTRTPAQPAARRPDSPPEVLFLARLHPRKRPATFARAAAALLGEGVEAQFTVAGPDEGEGAAVDQVIATAVPTGRLRREAGVPLDEVAARMARATVYVLPAVHEPFGMTVVEAMTAGLPVVVTDTCALAGFVRANDCGTVATDDADSIADAVRALLADPRAAADMGRRGAAAAAAHLGMDPVLDTLEHVYATATATTPATPRTNHP